MGIPGVRKLTPQLKPDDIASICTIARQLAVRIDDLIAQLAVSPERAFMYAGRETGGIAEAVYLLRLHLASMPRDHKVVTVTNEATPILENPSGNVVPVMVTNNDNAQYLRYGVGTLAGDTAPIIAPRAKEKIHIPPSTTLYGIVGGGDITVAVSRLALPETETW